MFIIQKERGRDSLRLPQGKDWNRILMPISTQKPAVHALHPQETSEELNWLKGRTYRTGKVAVGRQMHRHPQIKWPLLGCRKEAETLMLPPAGVAVAMVLQESQSSPQAPPSQGVHATANCQDIPRWFLGPHPAPKPVNKLSVRDSSAHSSDSFLGPAPLHIQAMSHPSSRPACRPVCVTLWSSLAPSGSAFAGCCSFLQDRGGKPE